jgi:Zn finger protein HypA/HybF involved in hydrogenase expression
MDCQSCADEIPDDSIFCPECGARQDLSNAGGRSFGVVTPQAVQAANQDETGAQPVPQAMDVDTLNRLAFQMKTGQSAEAEGNEPSAESPVDISDAFDGAISGTNQIVDRMVVAEKENKSEARSEWLTMNHQTATDVLSQVNAELPAHLRREEDASSGAARFLEEALGDAPPDPKDGPSVGLLRRMAEVAVRRVARKRGVAVESPQISLEDDLVRVNVTYIDDGRVLDTPSDLSNAFSHAIQTEVALKGLELSVSVVLFSSTEGEVSHVWGDAPEEEVEIEDEEEKFACEACGHFPVMESDPACPSCGAMFEDDDDDEDEDQDGMAGGPPSRGGPPRGPSRGGPGGSSGPPSRGSPPSRGPPSRGPSGPGGPGGSPSRGGPPSRGPSGPSGPGGSPSRGGPPSRGPSGPGGPGGPRKGGGPPGRGGPPSRGGPPKGGGPPKRGAPPRGPKKRGGPPR